MTVPRWPGCQDSVTAASGTGVAGSHSGRASSGVPATRQDAGYSSCASCARSWRCAFRYDRSRSHCCWREPGRGRRPGGPAPRRRRLIHHVGERLRFPGSLFRSGPRAGPMPPHLGRPGRPGPPVTAGTFRQITLLAANLAIPRPILRPHSQAALTGRLIIARVLPAEDTVGYRRHSSECISRGLQLSELNCLKIPITPHIAVAVGTRPEIVKLAHIVRMLGPAAGSYTAVSTPTRNCRVCSSPPAQLPAPETLSGICGEPRHVQIGRMVEQFGALFTRQRPAAVLVQGDTNTASAAAQAGNYAGVPVVHVEAGLRSFDRGMPEEMNRCVVGVLADLHCAPTERAVGQPPGRGRAGRPDRADRQHDRGSDPPHAARTMRPRAPSSPTRAPSRASTSSPPSTARRTPTIRSGCGPSSTS